MKEQCIVEIDGSRVAEWLAHSDLEVIRATLIGCSLDDGTSDAEWHIVSVGEDKSLTCIQAQLTSRFSLARLKHCVVLERGSAQTLHKLILESRSPYEAGVERARDSLRKHNIAVSALASGSDILVLLASVKAYVAKKLPQPNEQEKFYDVMKRTGQFRLGAKVCRQWLNTQLAQGRRLSGSTLIKLAFFLRHSGELVEALQATEPALAPDPRFAVSPGQRGVLASERAAILMDLFETRHNPELLREARKSAAVAYAAEPGPEAGLLYRRLEALERKFGIT